MCSYTMKLGSEMCALGSFCTIKAGTGVWCTDELTDCRRRPNSNPWKRTIGTSHSQELTFIQKFWNGTQQAPWACSLRFMSSASLSACHPHLKVSYVNPTAEELWYNLRKITVNTELGVLKSTSVQLFLVVRHYRLSLSIFLGLAFSIVISS